MTDWKRHFTHIVCLHAEANADRLPWLESELARVGIADSGIFRLHVSRAEDPDRDDAVARESANPVNWCRNVPAYIRIGYENLRILERCIAEDCGRILLLENDITFAKDVDLIEAGLGAMEESGADIVQFDRFVPSEDVDIDTFPVLSHGGPVKMLKPRGPMYSGAMVALTRRAVETLAAMERKHLVPLDGLLHLCGLPRAVSAPCLGIQLLYRGSEARRMFGIRTHDGGYRRGKVDYRLYSLPSGYRPGLNDLPVIPPPSASDRVGHGRSDGLPAVAAYTIVKDEIEFVQRYLDHMRGADLVCLLDTGSTDGTWEALQKAAESDPRLMVAQRIYQEWRFDVARNDNLWMLPAWVDVAVEIDADEYFAQDDWADTLRRAWRPEWRSCRVTNDRGGGLRFLFTKIARAHEMHWENAVHEVVVCEGEGVDARLPELVVEHHSKPKPTRSDYLPLLEMEVREKPGNDRALHYLMREYYYRGEYAKAVRTGWKHLALQKAWKMEQANTARYMVESMSPKDDWMGVFLLGWRLFPLKELFHAACRKAYRAGDWKTLRTVATMALGAPDTPATYLREARAQGRAPYLDYLSLAEWRLGAHGQALRDCREALAMDPDNERLLANVRSMENLISKRRT